MSWIGCGFMVIGIVCLFFGLVGNTSHASEQMTHEDNVQAVIILVALIFIACGILMVVLTLPPSPCAPNCPPDFTITW